jgi:hypothetical protein
MQQLTPYDFNYPFFVTLRLTPLRGFASLVRLCALAKRGVAQQKSAKPLIND